jgi:CubicO group peptidase (beta-lactamase class C family)
MVLVATQKLTSRPFLKILRGDPPPNNEQISLFTLLGLGFAYSGGGFTVLQLILETHLRKPLYSSMDETVHQPLKVSRSTI